MSIAAGINRAAALTKALRDALKGGGIKTDEVVVMLGEIYDSILDSKAALVEAQDEVQRLQQTANEMKEDREFRDSLTFHHAGFYERPGPHGVERYCSACLDSDGTRVRLVNDGEDGGTCHNHGSRRLVAS